MADTDRQGAAGNVLWHFTMSLDADGCGLEGPWAAAGHRTS